MSGYISKEDAMSAIAEVMDANYTAEEWHTDISTSLLATIFKMPSADVVERKRGEWELQVLDDTPPWTVEYLCNHCGEISELKTNFCPNCGADMRGE